MPEVAAVFTTMKPPPLMAMSVLLPVLWICPAVEVSEMLTAWVPASASAEFVPLVASTMSLNWVSTCL